MPHTKDVLAHPPNLLPGHAHPQHRAARKEFEKKHASLFGWKELALIGVAGLIFSMNIEKQADKCSKRNQAREDAAAASSRDEDRRRRQREWDREADREADRDRGPRRSFERRGHPDGRAPLRPRDGQYGWDARYDR